MYKITINQNVIWIKIIFSFVIYPQILNHCFSRVILYQCSKYITKTLFFVKKKLVSFSKEKRLSFSHGVPLFLVRADNIKAPCRKEGGEVPEEHNKERSCVWNKHKEREGLSCGPCAARVLRIRCHWIM